jgi:hypothetical protein
MTGLPPDDPTTLHEHGQRMAELIAEMHTALTNLNAETDEIQHQLAEVEALRVRLMTALRAAADARDTAAELRDAAAAARDVAADKRATKAADHPTPANHAADDRAAAKKDRQAAAGDRAEAKRDRDTGP